MKAELFRKEQELKAGKKQGSFRKVVGRAAVITITHHIMCHTADTHATLFHTATLTLRVHRSEVELGCWDERLSNATGGRGALALRVAPTLTSTCPLVAEEWMHATLATRLRPMVLLNAPETSWPRRHGCMTN